ncbi:MAG: aminoglycoside 6-adenylyltransferase [Candidatus Promineifilaceae bacterium]
MSHNRQSDPYIDLETRIADWAPTFSDIRAIVAYGSRALPGNSFDEFSDLDLVLFTADPDRYVEDSDWLGAIAEIWLAVLEQTGAGDPEWFVVYAGGLKVDIILSLVESDAEFIQFLDTSPYKRAFARGMRVIYHAPELALSRSAQAPELAVSALPTEIDLEKCVNSSLIRVVKAAMLLGRGELIRSLSVLDCGVRTKLLALLELHARATKDTDIDIWYCSRFLDQWADPDALATLVKTYSHYDAREIRQALLMSTELISRLAADTARARGYRFPTEGQRRTLAWLTQLLHDQGGH